MYKLLSIQKEIGSIKKDATNPFFKSKYVDINSLLEQIKPVLDKHKVILIQPLTNVSGRPAIRTALISLDNANVDTCIVEDVITLPDIQDPQKMGSAITYYRRYALQSLLALEAEDDDGNSASNTVKVKTKVKEIEKEEDPF